MSKLGRAFYLNTDVVAVAKSLLGKKLCTLVDGKLTCGIITETEAYEGVTDKACHAYNGRLTKRTATMYEEGGTAYIYLCYGIHHLFNVVTNTKGIPHAVLVRAILPTDGIIHMASRRNHKTLEIQKLANGPGSMSKALGLHTGLNNACLIGETVWIEDQPTVEDANILITPRIGVDYAAEHASWPYRFVVKSPETLI